MIKFEKEDLLKLAKLSALKVYDNEVDEFVNQIRSILDYTKELDQVNISQEASSVRNINIFREDIDQKFDSAPILKQAPKTKGSFFVVPAIKKIN